MLEVLTRLGSADLQRSSFPKQAAVWPCAACLESRSSLSQSRIELYNIRTEIFYYKNGEYPIKMIHGTKLMPAAFFFPWIRDFVTTKSSFSYTVCYGLLLLSMSIQLVSQPINLAN